MSQTRTNTLHYQNGKLHWGEVDLTPYGAETSKTPVFLYDLKGITSRFRDLQKPWPETRIYYAMKANPHPEVMQTLQRLGAGVDVVSGGEITRALECGFVGSNLVFSGVGKSREEIELALQIKIHQINVESIPELKRIASIAKEKNTTVDVVLRVNPNVSIQTHPYIATGLHENKFGLEFGAWPEIKTIFQQNRHVKLVGLSLHLGSQMLEFEGIKEALRLTKPFFQEIQKEFRTLHRFDFGGGLGIFYDHHDMAEEERLLQTYAEVVKEELKELTTNRGLELQTEPGRWLVAHAGILLTEIQYIKKTSHKNFAIVNTGMHHLLRPALYDAHHQIFPLQQFADRKTETYDVVGPICESADFLAKARSLVECREGEVLCIADTGAYGMAMASNYNLQTKAKEIFLK